MAESEEVDTHKVFSEDMLTIKQEFEDDSYMDHKIFVSETAICASDGQLNNNIRNDSIEEFKLSTVYIKTESIPETQKSMNADVKTEGEINVLDDMKIEIDNGSLFCDECHTYYENYCASCGMLVHILNRNVLSNIDNKLQEEIAQDILEIRDVTGQLGIFALKVIPEGVTFGPFIGLDTSECPWKLKGGRFVMSKHKAKFLNWMQYINPARSIFEQNLLAFQYEDYLYYQSNRQIHKGEELLVYFGGEYDDSLEKDMEIYFTPTMKDHAQDVFACTCCCLGFRSNKYLANHKSICRHKTGDEYSIEELRQCPYCKINLGEKEYSDHHMTYCREKDVREYIPMAMDNQSKHKINKRKTRCRPTDKGQFKCSVCEFRTNNKYYLRTHEKMKHFEEVHYECSSCEYKTNNKQLFKRHTKTIHLKEFRNKCTSCDYMSNDEQCLERHIKAKHLNTFDYKCASCEYMTNGKEYLERHIKTKHLEVFDYKCALCEYGANRMVNLKEHMKTKHLDEFAYKCASCSYKTNRKTHFTKHMKTIHLEVFDYQCGSCEYQANSKRDFKIHMKTKHLNEFDFKCSSCEYRTNEKYYLKKHIKAKHLEQFDYKCTSCDYMTNKRYSYSLHMRTKHLKEFDYKCASCDYMTNQKHNFEIHIKSKHLEEFDYKCTSCEYRTNEKHCLQNHMKTKHLDEFDYKCTLCSYKTNRKMYFKQHMKMKHLKTPT